MEPATKSDISNQSLASYYLVSCIYCILHIFMNQDHTFQLAIFICKAIFDFLSMLLFHLYYFKKLEESQNLLLTQSIFNKIFLILVIFFDNQDQLYLMLFQIDQRFYAKKLKYQLQYFAFANLLYLTVGSLKSILNHQDFSVIFTIIIILLQLIPEIINQFLNFHLKKRQICIGKITQFDNDYILSSKSKQLSSGRYINQNEQDGIKEDAYSAKFHSPQLIEQKISKGYQGGSDSSHQVGDPSNELSQLISRLSINNNNPKDKMLLKEIKLFLDQVWRQRMDIMPVGIAMINKFSHEIIYYNKVLIKMLKKILQISNTQFSQTLLKELQFKILENPFNGRIMKNSFSIDDNKFSSMLSNDMFHQLNRRGTQIRNPDDEFYNKFYSLDELLTKLSQNAFDSYINQEDNTLELYSTFEQSLTKKCIYLNCRILNISNGHGSKDYTIIIQDFSKQHQLTRIEEQNKFKTKIISSFSHELRTPLNGAILFLKGSLLDQGIPSMFKEKYLLPSMASLKMQNHLINDIIDFSQIDAGLIEIRLSTFNLTQLINEISEQFHYEFTMKKLGLAFIVDEGVPLKIKSDYQRLLQVLTNIIQNAQKFSEMGYVVVHISVSEMNQMVFEIQDEGCGISPSQLEMIQKVVNQEYESDYNEWQGFGLIITQMLLRYLSPIQNSNLQIESDINNKGTRVKFRITNHLETQNFDIQPFSRKKRQLSLPNLKANYGLIIKIKGKSQSKIILNSKNQYHTMYSQENIEEESNSLNLGSSILQYQGEQKSSLITDLDKQFSHQFSKSKQMTFQMTISNCTCKRILSVDDEVFNQISLQYILVNLGYKIEIAYNGRQAMEILKYIDRCGNGCRLFNLILMDCQMPIMDGWTTSASLKEMMKSKQIPNIPIIGLTAFTGSREIERCYSAGMTQVMHKPLNIDRFQELIGELRIFEII